MTEPTDYRAEAEAWLRSAAAGETQPESIEHSLPYGNVYYRTDRPVPVPVHQPARSPAEFVQYADDILEAVGYDPMYPEPHQHTDEPWPYRGF